jgi:hypothetical protein
MSLNKIALLALTVLYLSLSACARTPAVVNSPGDCPDNQKPSKELIILDNSDKE